MLRYCPLYLGRCDSILQKTLPVNQSVTVAIPGNSSCKVQYRDPPAPPYLRGMYPLSWKGFYSLASSVIVPEIYT